MLTIWHNPRCRKSRETLSILEGSGKPVTIRLYLEDVPSVSEIQSVLIDLGFEDPRRLMRRNESVYKSLNLKTESRPSKLIENMSEHPILIERPIVSDGQRAILGRPPEAIKPLL